MTRDQALGLLVLIPSIAAIGTALTGFAMLWYRRVEDRKQAAEREATATIAAFAGTSGVHSIIAKRAYEEIADSTEYLPRHEIPQSMTTFVLGQSVVQRAKTLTAELGNYAWRPNRPYRTQSFA